MAKNKTAQTESSVTDFINAVSGESKRNDSLRLIELFKNTTGFEPKMWGPSIIGFGSYHYQYASGHEGDAPLTGFSPRKDAFALYLYPEFGQREVLLAKLGKHRAGKGCVYIKNFDDITATVLSEMITDSVSHLKKIYPK